MTFLAPWSALVAAAITIPLLLLLYFLRLRRQRLRVASTLLWEKTFEDLQVNAPFQRLRWSLLLLLQLLLLALLLLALAEPVFQGETSEASRVVLLIDRSASMNAMVREERDEHDPPRTRFDAAKTAAKELIDSLGASGRPRQMMIIAFGANANVVTTFESDRRTLRDAVDSIQPSDEQADLQAALQLAGAFASQAEDATASRSETPDVVLLSDGGVSSAGHEGFALRAGRFRFLQVAPSSEGEEQSEVDNLGIASLSVRRDFEDPARVLLFARLVNAGAKPIDAVTTLMVDERVEATMRQHIPAATAEGLGEASLTHELDLAARAVLTLRHNHRDDLPSDDAAAIVLPAPRRPRIALVYGADKQNGQGEGRAAPDEGADPYLRELLEAVEPEKLDVLSASAFANVDQREVDSGALYDLIVFDRIDGARLPGVPALSFGGVPAGLRAVPAAEQERGHAILSWDRQHPLMRQVSLDTIVFTGFGGLELPSAATALAFGPDGAVIVTMRTRAAQHVIVGFALKRSNWPLHVSSTVFLQNAIDFLTMNKASASGLAFQPGAPITVRAQPGVRTMTIDGPIRLNVPVEGGELKTLPGLSVAGVYAVDGAAAPHEHIAVSVLSEVESDLRPRESVTINAESARAGRAAGAAPRPIWPWLAAAAMAVCVLEWLVYCRKALG